MALSPAVAEHLSQVIPPLAADIHRSCKVVPAEDIEQGMWEAAIARADKIAELLAEGKAWSIRRLLQQSAGRQIRAEDRYARAKRALALGYSTDDECFYSTGLLAQLLPLYLDGGVAAEPPKGRQVNTHVATSHEAGEYLAMMLDVDRGMKAISRHDRQLLERYYQFPQGSGGWTHEEMSSALGITPEACRKRVSRALRALQRTLGGPSPWTRPEAPSDAPERAQLARHDLDKGSGRA